MKHTKSIVILTFYQISFCGWWGGLDRVNRFNHTSWVVIVNPADRPQSVRNGCVIEVSGGVFCVDASLFGFSVGVGAFAIGLSQISSFLHYAIFKRMSMHDTLWWD